MAATVVHTAAATAGGTQVTVPAGTSGNSYRIQNKDQDITIYWGGSDEEVTANFASLGPGEAELVPEGISTATAPKILSASGTPKVTLTIYKTPL